MKEVPAVRVAENNHIIGVTRYTGGDMSRSKALKKPLLGSFGDHGVEDINGEREQHGR